jgi:hypothetical protein
MITHSRLYAAAWYEGGAKAILSPRRPTSPYAIIHRMPTSSDPPDRGGYMKPCDGEGREVREVKKQIYSLRSRLSRRRL